MRRHVRRALAAVGAVSAVTAAGLATTATTAHATSTFGYGTPTFVNSAAPSNVDKGLFLNVDFAGEPSIGTDWTTGAALYQASNSTYKVTFDNSTDPTTVNWSDVSSPYSQFNLDPILATHSATGTTMAGGDDGACGVMSTTHDDGASWLPTLPCPVAPDHPTVGIGPFHDPAPLDAVGTEAAYFCQQPILNAAPDECSYSHNGGVSWAPSTPDTSASACHSLFGHVKISPDGTAYIPDRTCKDAAGNSVVGGLLSTDNGQTLSSYAISGAPTPADGFDPGVATDANNRVYESWSRAGDYHPVISWSDDHGKTWAPQVDLAQTTSPALTAATFESAVAGDNGRAAVAYLGTWAGQPGQDPFTAGFNGIWYLFVSYTYDGGQTWQTVQATPDPVQRGEIDAGGTTTNGQRNLLDFMDASLTKDGRVVVGYADGCINACNTSGTAANSTDAWATVAYQSSGEGLFAAYDTAPPTTAPAAPTLSASTPKDGTVGLQWTVPSDGNSPITRYEVYRGTSAGNETPYASVSSGTSFTDKAVTLGSTYFYRVAAVNAIGTGASSNEASGTPTSVPTAPTLTATLGKSQVNLSWTPPSSNGGLAITGYSIYRGTSSGGETLIQTISSGTSYVDTTVSGGTTYYYTVRATNADGTGAASNEAKVTTKGKK